MKHMERLKYYSTLMNAEKINGEKSPINGKIEKNMLRQEAHHEHLS